MTPREHRVNFALFLLGVVIIVLITIWALWPTGA